MQHGSTLVRFDVEYQPAGWRVIDTRSGQTASVDGVVAEQLEEEEAGEIADLLNTLEFLNRGVATHCHPLSS